MKEVLPIEFNDEAKKTMCRITEELKCDEATAVSLGLSILANTIDIHKVCKRDLALRSLGLRTFYAPSKEEG